MHFAFIFVILSFQGVHSSHFSHHFQHHFLCLAENGLKMGSKMNKKWPKNGYHEQP